MKQQGQASPAYAPAQTGMQGGMFKTKICFNFQNTGDCMRGDGCHFAHGEHELQPGAAPMEQQMQFMKGGGFKGKGKGKDDKGKGKGTREGGKGHTLPRE